MIIELLLDGIYKVLKLLFVFKLPSLPDTVFSYIDTIFGYMEAGAGIVANYVPMPYVMSLFGVLLAVDAGLIIYHFVMWIVRKIPMLGVS